MRQRSAAALTTTDREDVGRRRRTGLRASADVNEEADGPRRDCPSPTSWPARIRNASDKVDGPSTRPSTTASAAWKPASASVSVKFEPRRRTTKVGLSSGGNGADVCQRQRDQSERGRTCFDEPADGGRGRRADEACGRNEDQERGQRWLIRRRRLLPLRPISVLCERRGHVLLPWASKGQRPASRPSCRPPRRPRTRRGGAPRPSSCDASALPQTSPTHASAIRSAVGTGSASAVRIDVPKFCSSTSMQTSGTDLPGSVPAGLPSKMGTNGPLATALAPSDVRCR